MIEKHPGSWETLTGKGCIIGEGRERYSETKTLSLLSLPDLRPDPRLGCLFPETAAIEVGRGGFPQPFWK